MLQELKIPTMDSMNDDEFFVFCEANRRNGVHFERSKEGRIIFMSPAGSISGHNDGEIFVEIKLWNRRHGAGFVFPSSTGFILPNNAIKSPDVAWISRERWAQVPPELRKKFAPICPDFVVEVKSESDTRAEHEDKMREYVDNGCRLGWLIDPAEQIYSVFTPHNLHPEKQPFGLINGGDVLAGLEIDLRTVFEDIG